MDVTRKILMDIKLKEVEIAKLEMQLSIAMLNKRALEIALLEMDTQLQLRELARPRPPPPPAPTSVDQTAESLFFAKLYEQMEKKEKKETEKEDLLSQEDSSDEEH